MWLSFNYVVKLTLSNNLKNNFIGEKIKQEGVASAFQ